MPADDNLCKSKASINEWFDFCCENSPLVSAAMAFGESYDLTENERMKVAIILLVDQHSKKLTEEWQKHEKEENKKNCF